MLTERQYRDFWAKVRVNPDNGCWEWTGTLANGYGKFRVGKHMVSAHRLAFELYSGPLPPRDGHHGVCVLHTCDNRACIRKEHLFLGTHTENMRDMERKGRRVQNRSFGMAHGMARHAPEVVARVHELSALGWRQCWIARDTGMGASNVSRILAGKRRPRG